MPIQGLTTGLEHEMPRLGQLRKGEEKPKGQKKPGKDLDHFRFVCNDPRIDKRFHDIYKEKPRVINVHLPFPDAARNFPTWNEEWGAGSLKHRCDGKVMILWQGQDSLYHTRPEACPYADLPKNDPDRKCKQRGLLRVIIDELGEWGYVDVVTGGKWDCIGLTQNVLEVEEMARIASAITGRPIGVQGIPCQLKREMRMTSCPPLDGKGPRVRLEKWMLYLYVAPGYIERLMAEMQRYSLPVVDLPQLSAPQVDLEVDYYVGNGDEDVEHPEVEIVDDEPEPAPEPQAGNGKWPARPWDAETTRAALNKAAEKVDPGRKALKTHQKAALVTLNKLSLGDDEKRHKLTWFLFGTESSKELSAEQCAVINEKWAKVEPPDFEPAPAAVEEARRILEALGFEDAVEEPEQEELPF